MNKAAPTHVCIDGRVHILALAADARSALQEVCRSEDVTFANLCRGIDRLRTRDTDLQTALVLFLLDYFRTAAMLGGADTAGTLLHLLEPASTARH